jgi:uncharacterized membrane protein (UPF0127 family)
MLQRLSYGSVRSFRHTNIFESSVTENLRVRYSASLKLRITNLTRNTVLGDSIDVADTSAKRRTGLLKHERLGPGEGLWIVPCESVHTLFMKFPIDLVYLGKDQKVRKVRHAVKPWRLSVCLSAHSILELPAGAAEKTGTQTGDELGVERLGEPDLTQRR